VPLTPIDSSYGASITQAGAPQVNATYTDFDGVRTQYIFAYATSANLNAGFRLSDLGVAQKSYLFDYLNGTGRLVNPSDLVTGTIPNNFLYWIAAPVGPSGFAVIGDTGQFVTMGKKRISQMTDNGVVSLKVTFAPGEKARTILGYAPARPAVKAAAGTAGLTSYNAATRIFRISLSPGPDGTATLEIMRGGSLGRK
jgi:hypothetical protein